MKPITIAIAGCGSRGMQAYAPGQALFPGRMRIVAAADIRPGQLALMRERYGLTQAQCYDSAESMLRQPRLASNWMPSRRPLARRPPRWERAIICCWKSPSPKPRRNAASSNGWRGRQIVM